MAQALTLVCKIQPSDDEHTHLDETLRMFTDACAWIHAQLPARITNVMRMQAMLYYAVRSRFGLSSNLAQQAFRRVAVNRKTAQAQGEKVKGFDATSMQYDQRIFAFRERDWTVSLTLLHRRVRFPLHLGNYQRGRLTGQRPTRAQLCRHKDGSYAAHIQIKAPVPPPTPPDDIIGVDLGRTDGRSTSFGSSSRIKPTWQVYCCSWSLRPIRPRCAMRVCIWVPGLASGLLAPMLSAAGLGMLIFMVLGTSAHWACM